MTQHLMTYREALKQAHRHAMLNDERVFLMGEDVGAYGGCYAVSKGMLDEFGPERIRNTPLSENAFTGIGIGAALGGMRPIVEIMTINFSLLALDQIINNAAILSHMSGGQFAVPLVIRMATGGGRQVAAQHSNSFEGWYAHIPGVKLLAPAIAQDAFAMLKPALDDPNPVIICEHASLYNNEEVVDTSKDQVDITKAMIRKEGNDVSLIAYGGMIPKAMAASEALAKEGVNVEVIDLRVLRPLDNETIIQSIIKTHRAVIVDEGWKSVSLSAEIMARIMEEAFYELDAPLVRVCSKEVPIPYAKHLEDAVIPQIKDIIDAVKQVVSHHV